MQDAVTSTDGGTLLRIELTPGADADTFPDGYNRWRDVVTARVTAPPQDGKANRALIDRVAEHFGLSGDEVWITNGHRSRRKTLMLSGLTVSEVQEGLSEVLPA